MLAAVLEQVGLPLNIKEVSEPSVYADGVKVRVINSHVLSFTATVLSGGFPFELPVPYIPGPACIGEVEEVGCDVIGIKVGQKVFCSPYLEYIDNQGNIDELLIGWFGLSRNAAKLQQKWKNGSFAEKAVYPSSCISVISPMINLDEEKFTALNYCAIAGGGLVRGNLQAGESVLINGASGNMGSMATLVALAMGAAKVYVAARDQSALDELVSVDPVRVIPVLVPSVEEEMSAVFAKLECSVDLLIDALGLVGSPVPTISAMAALKPRGRMVFIGGVYADLPLNYGLILARQLEIKGSFMYPHELPARLLKFVESGALNLAPVTVEMFGLNQIEDAIKRAGKAKGFNFIAVGNV